jgi:hypothetical protein
MAVLGLSIVDGPSSLIMASYSLATWKSMETVVKNWIDCFNCNCKSLTHPTQDNVEKFIWWGFHKKGWKWSTLVSYVSLMSNVFKLKGHDISTFGSFRTKNLLKGVRNLESVDIPIQNKRNVFTFPLLKLLGHAVANSNWSIDSKSIFWTTCSLLFFGSLRIGEILAANSNSFDPLTTLLWNDVFFGDDFVRLHIRFPKVFSAGGVTIDLFRISDKNLCPVACLLKLQKNKNSDFLGPTMPVFRFNSGILLTPKDFNATLRSLLSQILGKEAGVFSSHSFRAAIPAALAENPSLASKESVMGWGRWDSEAYQRYTRLKLKQRRHTFQVICSIFGL